jgi:Flagellar hook capping protein
MADVSSVGSAWTKYEDTIKKDSGGDSLGKEDFLKLLIAQLTNQDPTNPMNDTEFVSQLATYSGLEQQMNMNKNLETLINSTNASTATTAIMLIDRMVGYLDEDGKMCTGVVQFLDIVDGEVNLYMYDGSYIPFSKVEQVANVPVSVPDDDDGGEGEGEKEPAEGA